VACPAYASDVEDEALSRRFHFADRGPEWEPAPVRPEPTPWLTMAAMFLSGCLMGAAVAASFPMTVQRGLRAVASVLSLLPF
jgi:hypothetical protein